MEPLKPSPGYTSVRSIGLSHDKENGSASDVSTSTETLSPEDRHALRHTRRQDPQGQEHVPPSLPSTMESNKQSPSRDQSRSPINENNLSMCSSTNTMIIHHSVADDSWTRQWMPSNYSTPAPGSRKQGSSSLNSEPQLPSYNTHIRKMNTESLNLNQDLNSSLLDSSLIKASSLLNSNAYSASYVPKNTYLNLNETGINSPKHPIKQEQYKYLPDDLNYIQNSFLDQSEVLKHLLSKDRKGYSDDQSGSSSNSGLNLLGDDRLRDKDLDYAALLNLPPPPAYPQWQREPETNNPLLVNLPSDSLDKSQLSRSQPDLSKIVASVKDAAASTSKDVGLRLSSDASDEREKSLLNMIETLAQENNGLKTQLDVYKRKIIKLQRFEEEIIKVDESHKHLMKLSSHREQLERLARHKLNLEINHLKETNTELKEQLDLLSNQISSVSRSTDKDTMRKEMNKRDVLIAQLISQNKELIAAKERQEIELTAQRQTLNEQRTHIDILDNALTNAQTNAVKLEEEVRKKQNLVEQAGQLKRLLTSIQLAADRREQSEKSLREKLEREIVLLRSGTREDVKEMDMLQSRRELREKEEKIMILEGEVTKWEQRYLQESAMRQLAIEAASMPKDAKIAALEKTSQESDRRIAQAKSDQLRNLDDINNMSKKLKETTNKNKELESRVAEKDAMIRVLQKRVEEKENLYQSAVRSSVPSEPTKRGSTSGSTISSGGEGASSNVSGGSGNAFISASPQTPRREQDLGQIAPPIPPFPPPHLYSSTSALPSSLSLLPPCHSSSKDTPKNDRRPTSYRSTDEVSYERSPRKNGPRFASQELLDVDSYQEQQRCCG